VTRCCPLHPVGTPVTDIGVISRRANRGRGFGDWPGRSLSGSAPKGRRCWPPTSTAPGLRRPRRGRGHPRPPDAGSPFLAEACKAADSTGECACDLKSSGDSAQTRRGLCRVGAHDRSHYGSARRHRMLATSRRAAAVASSTGQTLNQMIGVRAPVSEVSTASATSNPAMTR
jgi:hypothetical protein